MSPDTIITAEILAGLTHCPFCGASADCVGSHGTKFQCGSWFLIGSVPISTKNCCNRQQIIAPVAVERDTLRARVKELESKVSEVEELHSFELSPAMIHARNDQLNERVKALEARINRLIEAGDGLSNALNGSWNGSSRTADTQANGAIVQWTAAKEVKA